MHFHPWQLLSVIFAGILSDQQQRVIDYLREVNRVLRRQLGKKRLRLTDDERRRLAAKGKVPGRRALDEICTIYSPGTILRWHPRSSRGSTTAAASAAPVGPGFGTRSAT